MTAVVVIEIRVMGCGSGGGSGGVNHLRVKRRHQLVLQALLKVEPLKVRVFLDQRNASVHVPEPLRDVHLRYGEMWAQLRKTGQAQRRRHIAQTTTLQGDQL